MVPEKKRVKTRIGEIAYVDQGAGPVALFVHGVFLNSYLWRHVIAQVRGERRCIALDLISHGDSPAEPNQDVSFRAQAEMLEAFCEALDLDQVDLVANDSGGAIAQIFAAHHPERLRSFTLTNCDVHDNYPPPALAPLRAAAAAGGFSARWQEFRDNIALLRPGYSPGYEDIDRVSDETLRTYAGPLFSSQQRARDLERWLTASGDNRQTTEIEPLLRKLHAPTLIVWGTGDVFFPVKWAYWLQSTIPGTRKVVELKGARLFFPDERPEALVEHLREHWAAALTVPNPGVVSSRSVPAHSL
jgi:pimeloyl-ACP methyl ester carboxylesterase